MAEESVSQGAAVSAPRQLERRWQAAFRARWQSVPPRRRPRPHVEQIERIAEIMRE